MMCVVNEASLERACQVIQDGGLIVLPTDTVYGIACDPCNADALAKLYQAKQRPNDKPLQVLLSSLDQMDLLGLSLPPVLKVLSDAFLPGALSLVAHAHNGCSLCTIHGCRSVLNEEDGNTSAQATQAIRIPDCAATLRILRVTGPLAASSANKSGYSSARTVQEAYNSFGDEVDLYLDAGPTPGHVASTVVAADSADISIIRQGVISESAIRSLLKELQVKGDARA